MNKTYRYAFLAILCWSSVSTAFKLSLDFLSPLGLLLFSSLSASIFLGIVFFAQGHHRRQTQSFMRNLRVSLLSGFLNPFLYYLVLFEAYNRLQAQEAQVLNYTWAIVLSIMAAIFFKQKFGKLDLLALMVSFMGVVVIATKGRILSMSFTDPVGTGLAVASSLIWASYWLLNMNDKRELVPRLFYNFVAGSTLIGIHLVGLMMTGYRPLIFIGNKLSSSWGLVGAVYVGIFEMGLTFILWNKALSLTDKTSKIANLIFLTPFISLMFIAVLLKESISITTLLGLALIISGNMIQQIRKGRQTLLDS